ncbi:hypothetical protein C9I57_12205 [Trinickia symbiotica]|uniref:Uncharacterized protein n=2 Tax=Trinickia symbiotica TaxID=863227 RepID=A0A2T3XVP4_9BURK|nr:hypothetical protein C9I57_12205 [Trinickia symbiotica]
MPRLNIYTNEPDIVAQVISHIPAALRPAIHHLVAKTSVPAEVRFHAAHFKLDLMESVAKQIPRDILMALLDTDMVALKPLNTAMLIRCSDAGVGAFDISDQVFPAYGCDRVIGDLEIVAGGKLKNPRWYGGEFLLTTQPFLETLVKEARLLYGRYIDNVGRLHHQGDEMFMSAALNTLSDSGQEIVEVGAYQAIGRHWRGNTHRDMRWFKNCSLVHLPSGKKIIEEESKMIRFDAKRVLRKVYLSHLSGRMSFIARQSPLFKKLRAV